MPGSWVPSTVGDAAALTGESDGLTTLRFDVGEGWIATLQGQQSPLDPATVAARLRQVADSLRVQSPEDWAGLVDRIMGNGDRSTTGGQRLGVAGDAGTTLVQSVDLASVVSALVVPEAPTAAYQLRTTVVVDPGAELPSGARARVRDHDAVLAEQADSGGGAHRVLVWVEEGFEHRLFFSAVVSAEQANAMADRLTVLDDSTWRTALFPTAVPASLPDAFWTRLPLP